MSDPIPRRPSATKRVHWGTAQILEFRVGYNGCAVPSSGGPPVGLIRSAIRETELELLQDVQSIETEDLRPATNMRDCWINAAERVQILEASGDINQHEIALMTHLARVLQSARAQSQRDFDVADAFASGELERLKILCELGLLPHTARHQSIPTAAAHAHGHGHSHSHGDVLRRPIALPA